MSTSTIINHTILMDNTTFLRPSIVEFEGCLYLAWTGRDYRLNLMVSTDGGSTFGNQCIFSESERAAFGPALCVHNGMLYIAWTGYAMAGINLVSLDTFQGGGGLDRKISKKSLHVGQSTALGAGQSAGSLGLASANGKLYIAWTDLQSNQLNVMYSTDDGNTVAGIYTSSETSDNGPSLCLHQGRLYIAWSGSSPNILVNVAGVPTGDTPGPFTNKLENNPTTLTSPSLASAGGYLYIAWADDSDLRLNGMLSLDNGQSFDFQYTSADQTSQVAPTLCDYNNSTYIAWAGVGNCYINVAEMIIALPRRSSLAPGQYLAPGSQLVSPNGLFILTYNNDDGTLVLTDWKQQPLWNSNYSSSQPTMAVYDSQGNFYCYDANYNAYFTISSDNNSPFIFTLQANGNLVIYDDNQNVQWQSNTAQQLPTVTRQALFAGDIMFPGDVLVSANRRFSLIYQTDGNVVLYDGYATPVWQTETGGLAPGNGRLVMQGDGNLVLYAIEDGEYGTPLWAINQIGATLVAGSHAILQDDGDLAVYSGSTITNDTLVWDTGINQDDPDSFPTIPEDTTDSCAPVLFTDTCGADNSEMALCGSVFSLQGGCDTVLTGLGLCAAVYSSAGACGAVIGLLGACGADADVINACGIVAGGAGAQVVALSAVGDCGVVATVASQCGAVTTGISFCAAVDAFAGLCGALYCGEEACGAVVNGTGDETVEGIGACGAAVVGVQGIGACALEIGFCGAVACIAVPIGGNW